MKMLPGCEHFPVVLIFSSFTNILQPWDYELEEFKPELISWLKKLQKWRTYWPLAPAIRKSEVETKFPHSWFVGRFLGSSNIFLSFLKINIRYGPKQVNSFSRGN